MREIKFRAWDKRSEKMVDQQYLNCHRSGFFLLRGDEFEFMQFTGLHDKNGMEIYEGDVVHMDDADGVPHPCEVTFTDCSWRCDSKDGEWGEYFKEFVGGVEGRAEELEIIGNIYETPELLTV